MAKKDTRRVVTIIHPDGTETRRLVAVCRPDRRRPDWVNRLTTGAVRGPPCRTCGVHHSIASGRSCGT
jgi:hypothetical protein